MSHFCGPSSVVRTKAVPEPSAGAGNIKMRIDPSYTLLALANIPKPRGHGLTITNGAFTDLSIMNERK